MEKANMRREEFRSTRVCIDSYENNVPRGSIYNPCCEEGCSFESTTQFLLEMEKLLEQMEFPKAFQSPRSFAKVSGTSTGPPAEPRRSGNMATFTIRVLFRQNASWQGSVIWHPCVSASASVQLPSPTKSLTERALTFVKTSPSVVQ